MSTLPLPLTLHTIELTMLKESAIQNPTKFHAPHVRLAGSTEVKIKVNKRSIARLGSGPFQPHIPASHRMRRENGDVARMTFMQR